MEYHAAKEMLRKFINSSISSTAGTAGLSFLMLLELVT